MSGVSPQILFYSPGADRLRRGIGFGMDSARSFGLKRRRGRRAPAAHSGALRGPVRLRRKGDAFGAPRDPLGRGRLRRPGFVERRRTGGLGPLSCQVRSSPASQAAQPATAHSSTKLGWANLLDEYKPPFCELDSAASHHPLVNIIGLGQSSGRVQALPCEPGSAARHRPLDNNIGLGQSS